MWLARVLALVLCLSLCLLTANPVWAGIKDDHFDGNIFALYAGNGSLVPPKTTLANSLRSDRPTLLTFYVDDSRDCKQFSAVISQLQSYYGRVADFIPVILDAIPLQTQDDPTEPAFYYKGYLPQTVIFDVAGQVVFEGAGQVPFEDLDDAFRTVFDLLPRSESLDLKRRPLNEVNAELVR
nr:thylakoid membrane photosystem I accumulation factor [Petrachloros mirabilis]